MRCTFTVDRFASGRSCIGDNVPDDYQMSFQKDGRDTNQNLNVVELAMHKWRGENSRPFLFAILCDGTILCYRGFDYDDKLRFSRVDFDYTKGRMPEKTQNQRITTFERVGDCQGLFLSGSRPTWFMKSRERFQIHPQLCDGPICGFTAVHTSYCEHGFIYASQGAVKLCQLPPLSYDHHWPIQKVFNNLQHLSLCSLDGDSA
ncbi:cleavage and polyadenylation specificity factor subunit 1 isoform X1 [Tanacetum coccineum]